MRFGKDWDGHLTEWLSVVRDSTPEVEMENYCFPTGSLRDEYIRTVERRPDDEVAHLLRLFLFDESTFGRDHEALEILPSLPLEKIKRALDTEYYRRLLSPGVHPHPGIRWATQLLPHQPRLAIEAIHAYLMVHWQYLPDGRVNGLFDAMEIIRARYIGSPHGAEPKRRLLQDLSSRDFERVVERLYQRRGYSTTLTPSQNDGGRDVVATRVKPGEREELHIEAKRHSQNVRRPIVQQLLGVVEHHKANKGVLVTTADFSRGALDFAEQNPRIELIGGRHLVVMLNESFGSD